MKMFFFLFCIFNLYQPQKTKIDYYSPENIYRFAIHLYEEGDYLRAANEFQRYIFCFDTIPSNGDSIFYIMGMCYLLAGVYSKAIDYFQYIIKNYSNSILLSNCYYQISLAYFLAGEYDKSIRSIFLNQSSINQNDIKLKMNRLIIFNYLLQKKWKDAVSFVNNLDTIMREDLLNYIKEWEELPRKNKFLAGLFSSIIPGSGKIYCNRHWDGFFSLITIGIMGWQAYDGFYQNGIKSIKGWILGTAAMIFYLGNIYGSVVAAQIYNEGQEEKFFNKIKFSVNANIR